MHRPSTATATATSTASTASRTRAQFRMLGAPSASLAALALLLVVVSACSGPRAGHETSPATARDAVVAEAVGSTVSIFAAAGAEAPSATENSTLPTGTPRAFLVLDQQGSWLHALLPDGPNGATGWLRRADVTVTSDALSVDVSLSARSLTVKQSGRTVLIAPVGVGAPATPTPTGAFFITELLKPPNPDGAYGPYAFGLSGHSQVLHSFAGGDGQIGIHGTNDPTSIGQAVTHGCIRLHDDAVTQLAGILPLGTPVVVHT